MESIKELRARVQSVHKGDFSADMMRTVSIYITWLLIPTKISANAVSLANVLVGVAAGVCFGIGRPEGWIAGALLFTFNTVLDSVDGEIARYWKKSSFNGLFMDRINSIFLYPALFAGIGFGLLRTAFEGWLLAAVLAAVWSSVAIRLAKTSVDTTVIDAFTMAKARREAPATLARTAYVPMAHGLRTNGKWYLWALDFVTIRQPGFNMVLLAATGAQVGLEMAGATWGFSPLMAFVVGYAVVFSLAVPYIIAQVVRGNRIDVAVEHLKDVAGKGIAAERERKS